MACRKEYESTLCVENCSSKNLFYYTMSLTHLVQSVEMGGEHFLQRSKVPCIDNKAWHQNARKKINAKCKVTPRSQQTWGFLASQTRWASRGFPECCFSPPKSGLRSQSTGRGSEETPQGPCKVVMELTKLQLIEGTEYGIEYSRWETTEERVWQHNNAEQETSVSRRVWQDPEPAAGYCRHCCPNKPERAPRCCSACETDGKKAQGSSWHIQSKSLRTGGSHQERVTACPASPVGSPSQTEASSVQHLPWRGLLHDKNGIENKYNLIQSQT